MGKVRYPAAELGPGSRLDVADISLIRRVIPGLHLSMSDTRAVYLGRQHGSGGVDKLSLPACQPDSRAIRAAGYLQTIT